MNIDLENSSIVNAIGLFFVLNLVETGKSGV